VGILFPKQKKQMDIGLIIFWCLLGLFGIALLIAITLLIQVFFVDKNTKIIKALSSKEPLKYLELSP
jgi:hypothetical protein